MNPHWLSQKLLTENCLESRFQEFPISPSSFVQQHNHGEHIQNTCWQSNGTNHEEEYQVTLRSGAPAGGLQECSYFISHHKLNPKKHVDHFGG